MMRLRSGRAVRARPEGMPGRAACRDATGWIRRWQALLDNLDLLARRELRRLMTICGVDAEDLADMIAEIRSARSETGGELRHGARAARGAGHPDAAEPWTMRWLIELNPDTMPRLLVNERFYARVAPRARKEDRLFLAEQLASANWLVRSLQQRAQTILKVAAEIIRQQDGFMRHGVAHLRPLILRDIAEAVEMHESTVSRVTANKYIATPRGTFELKYFFTTAIPGTDGESHSAEAVRYRIRAMIDAETGRRRPVRRCDRGGSAATRAWTLPAGPWPNTARRCASPARCSASGRRPCWSDTARAPAVHSGERHDADHGFGQAGRSVGRAAHARVRSSRRHRQQVFRPCAGGAGHVQPRAQLLHLRYQRACRPRPDAARRRRGGRRQHARSTTPPNTSPSGCAAIAGGSTSMRATAPTASGRRRRGSISCGRRMRQPRTPVATGEASTTRR